MKTISKYALTFNNRMLSFDQDLELVDIICKAQKANDFLKSETNLFSYQNQRHVALSTRKNTNQSRTIVVNHLKTTVYSSYIKDLYEELSSYLKNLLYEAAKIAKDASTAKRLLGEHKVTIIASEILTYNNIDEIAQFIANSIIQSLESERSTKDLIKKICTKINISISDELINQALPFLELRHKLVHTDGKADEDFMQKYSCFKYDEKKYIVIDLTIIKKAKTTIKELIMAIDKEALEKGILSPNT